MLRRRLKLNLIKFLRLKGAPGKIALGFALGACVNFYPTFGVGVPFAGLMAGIAMANVPAGLLGDIIFKPLFPFFFYLNLMTGHLFWSGKHGNLSRLWWTLIHRPTLHKLGAMGKVFFTGAVVNSLILGTILYILIYFIVERYRGQILKLLVARNRRK